MTASFVIFEVFRGRRRPNKPFEWPGPAETRNSLQNRALHRSSMLGPHSYTIERYVANLDDLSQSMDHTFISLPDDLGTCPRTTRDETDTSVIYVHGFMGCGIGPWIGLVYYVVNLPGLPFAKA